MIGSFFSHFATAKAGTGQVKTWKDAADHFAQAKSQFLDHIIPKEVRVGTNREKVWNELWRQFIQVHLRSEERRDYLLSEDDMNRLLRGDFSVAPVNDEAV